MEYELVVGMRLVLWMRAGSEPGSGWKGMS
jgi:hypothetical protein